MLAGFVANYHRGVIAGFYRLGQSIAKRPVLYFVCGVVAAAVLIAGVYRAEQESVVSELWREKGGEMDSQKAFYDAHFGGIGRGESVMLLSNTDDGIGSVATLDAMLEGVIQRLCGRFARGSVQVLRRP